MSGKFRIEVGRWYENVIGIVILAVLAFDMLTTSALTPIDEARKVWGMLGLVTVVTIFLLISYWMWLARIKQQAPVRRPYRPPKTAAVMPDETVGANAGVWNAEDVPLTGIPIAQERVPIEVMVEVA